MKQSNPKCILKRIVILNPIKKSLDCQIVLIPNPIRHKPGRRTLFLARARARSDGEVADAARLNEELRER
jgi:hypothetical protein